MHYVMSDLHGEYEKYLEMLKKIKFTDDDVLYVLGDVVDRGKHPIKILQDMMQRFNVYPLIGNHDYMYLLSLKTLLTEITNESIEHFENEDQLQMLQFWLQEGGQTTLDEFMQLSKEEMQDIEDYLGEFSLYEEIHVNGKVFILVHAGLDNFNTARSLDDYELYEVIFKRTNYTKVYYPDKYLVTGHTPTQVIKGNSRPGFIYQKNHHIAIDCGCVFGGKLACLCLETMEEFYV